MKLKLKLIMIALGAGSIALQLGSCGRFWGDWVGDVIFLQGVD